MTVLLTGAEWCSLVSACATCLGKQWDGGEWGRRGLAGGNREVAMAGFVAWMLQFLVCTGACLISLTPSHIHRVARREMSWSLLTGWCLCECGQGSVYGNQTLLLLVVLCLSCLGPFQLPGTPSSGPGAVPSTLWIVFSSTQYPSTFHQHFIFRSSSWFLIHQGTLS